MNRLKSIQRILTLRCEEASELSSRELDEELPRLDRAALFCHLLLCRSCRRFCKQIRTIRLALRTQNHIFMNASTNDAFLSPEARIRIAYALREAGRDQTDADRYPEFRPGTGP